MPDAYAIDKGPYCEGCGKCVPVCPTAAIKLEEEPRTEVLTVSAIVLATGLRLSDPASSAEYGYGRYANVFTGLEMERMCSPAGPGEGRILRRSDGQPPRASPGCSAWARATRATTTAPPSAAATPPGRRSWRGSSCPPPRPAST